MNPNTLKPLRSFGFLLVAVLFITSGCKLARDVTASPEGRTDFIPGRTYRLKQPVFLFKADKNSPKETPMLAELGFGGTATNLDEFRRSQMDAPQVAGLLLPGEQVRVSRFEEHKVPALGTFFDVFGVVASGDYKGTTVKLNLITKEMRPTSHAFISHEYLEPVE